MDLKDKSVGQLVDMFVGKRDALSAARKEFKSFEEETKMEMEMLEGAILDIQRDIGVESLSTNTHTAFQTTKRTVRIDDWDTFSEWIIKTGNTHCIEKRCAKNACIEVEEAEGIDLFDIGLRSENEIKIQVRKK